MSAVWSTISHFFLSLLSRMFLFFVLLSLFRFLSYCVETLPGRSALPYQIPCLGDVVPGKKREEVSQRPIRSLFPTYENGYTFLLLPLYISVTLFLCLSLIFS